MYTVPRERISALYVRISGKNLAVAAVWNHCSARRCLSFVKGCLEDRGDRAACAGVCEGTSAGSMEQGMLSVCEVCGFCFLQYQKAVVPEQFAKVLYNGNRIEPEMIRSFEESMQQKPIRIYDEKDHFIGIYEFQQERETSNL